MSELDITCVILAAGASRRFGSPKMLHPLSNGKLMIEQNIETCLEVFESVSVVVRANSASDELITLLAPYSVNIVESENSEQGMSQSVVAGVRAKPHSDAWLIVLADMPYVRAETIQSLVNQQTENNIVLPRYYGRTGNPVGFGAFAKNGLLMLQGDRGAKSIIQQNQQCVDYVDTDDEGVVIDLDYPSAVN